MIGQIALRIFLIFNIYCMILNNYTMSQRLNKDFENFINQGPEVPDFRLETIEDVIRDNTIEQVEKEHVLKCYKFVKDRYELTGLEPINGNTCVTVDGVYHCIKIHPDKTISHVKVMEGQRGDYMKLQIH